MSGELEVGEVRPLPNVVTAFREDLETPIDWSITPAFTSNEVKTDFSKGQMIIPVGDDPYSQRIQIREQVNARSTVMDPNVYKEISQLISTPAGLIRSAEVARMNVLTGRYLQQFGIPDEADGSEKITGQRLATIGNIQAWQKTLQTALELHGTEAYKKFATGVRSVNSEWGTALHKLDKRLKKSLDIVVTEYLGSTTPSHYKLDGEDKQFPNGFRYALDAANNAASFLAGGSNAPKDIKEAHKKAMEKKAAEYGKNEASNKDPRTANELSEEQSELSTDDIPDDFDFKTAKQDLETGEVHHPDEIGGAFAELKVDDTLPLTVEVAGYLHRKRRAMTSGRKVRYPSRMITDPQRRVFANKVRVRGGIVVIDISGSMSLSQEQIESIVEAAPASVILAYSFSNWEEPNAWIFANRGWRVREIPYVGGNGNGVDGPAIAWAIRHRKGNEPIIWVTDGQVTSATDGNNPALNVLCAKLVKKHRIIMIPSVEEAVKQFKAGRFVNKPSGRVRDALLGYYS